MFTSENQILVLEGVALDEAVAKAIGVEPGADYSTSWHHGGPLIEKYQLYVWPEVSQPAYQVPDPYWAAGRRGLMSVGWKPVTGKTPLQAAMRAIVWALEP